MLKFNRKISVVCLTPPQIIKISISDHANLANPRDEPFEDEKEEARFQSFLRLMKFKHRSNFLVQHMQSKIDNQIRSTFQYNELKQISDQLDTQMNP